MSESDLKALDPALCLSAVQHRAEVAEARLHALTRQLVELATTADRLQVEHERWIEDPKGGYDGLIEIACDMCRWLHEFCVKAEEAARVDTPDPSTALVPHPSLGDESTDQPVKEPFGIWQPIATAPKDGTEILLRRDILGLQPSHWMPLPSPPRVMGDK